MYPNYYNSYHPRTSKPSKEVYDLRRAGNLQEAYELAVELVMRYNDDDTKGAYAYTLIDLTYQELGAGNVEKAHEYFNELSSIEFDSVKNGYPEEFTMGILKKIEKLRSKFNPHYSSIQQADTLSKAGNHDEAFALISDFIKAEDLHLPNDAVETCGWIMFRYIKSHINDFAPDQMRSLLMDYMCLPNTRPSLLHSQMLGLALNYSKGNPDFKFIPFVKIWGYNNFRTEDFRDTPDFTGKTIHCLITRITKEMTDYPTEEIDEFYSSLPQKKDLFVDNLRESIFWKIYHKIEDKSFSEAMDMFENYAIAYPKYGASKWHSEILSLAVRNMNDTNTSKFYFFFQKWNPDNLREEDWVGGKGNDGETYSPLAVKAIKKADAAMGSLPLEETGDLEWLIKLYEIAEKKIPDDDWTTRDKAQLYLKTGKTAEAEAIYKDLIMRLGDKSYMWSEFADTVSDNELKMAMLCKAISTEKKEEFLGKIRFKLAELLINNGQKKEAFYELKTYKETCVANQWNLNPKVDKLMSICSSQDPVKDNSDLYERLIPIAEEYAYSGIPFKNLVMVDEWKNEKGKKYQKYIDGRGFEISVSLNQFPTLKKAKFGQVWGIKIYEKKTTRTIPSLYSFGTPKTETTVEYTPLVARKSDLVDWSILPGDYKYGYIQYVNKEKKSYHIYTTDSQLIYKSFNSQEYNAGDFVAYRSYTKTVKGKQVETIFEMSKCTEKEALSHFSTMYAAIDNVNETKKLYHFVTESKEPGSLYFEQTDLQLSVGDCIKIAYYSREKKGGHKHIIEVLRAEKTDKTIPDIIKDISGQLELKYKRSRNDYDDYDDYEYYDEDEEDDSETDNPLFDVEEQEGNGDTGSDETDIKVTTADFAFIRSGVSDYYVHRRILEKFHITKDCYISGKAIRSADGRWEVFELYPQTDMH